jgi:hypothetical protein
MMAEEKKPAPKKTASKPAPKKVEAKKPKSALELAEAALTEALKNDHIHDTHVACQALKKAIKKLSK